MHSKPAQRFIAGQDDLATIGMNQIMCDGKAKTGPRL